MRALLLLALAALLAGCTAPADPAAPGAGAGLGAPAAETAVVTEPADAEALAAPAGPLELFLTPDLALVTEPGAAGSVTLSTPVNGPETPGYPQWNGTLPRAVNLTSAGLQVTFYVRANTASVRGNQLPPFAEAPAFYVEVDVGEKGLGAQVDGPPTMLAGDIYKVTASANGDTGLVAEGAAVSLMLVPIYTHVTHAAQVEFVMGPDQPARLSFA